MSRVELYELVWSEAVVVLAPRFGLSDVALTKRCKKLGVPTPPRGYWAKVEAGKKVKRLPLPKSVPQEKDAPYIPQRVEDMVYYSPEGNFSVKRPHPVTAITKAVNSSWLSGRGFPDLAKGQVPFSTDVSKESAARAHWVIDRLLKEFERLGAEVRMQEGRDRGVHIHAFGEFVTLILKEKIRRFENPDYVPGRPNSYREPNEQYIYRYAGLLRIQGDFSNYCPCWNRKWRDTPTRPLHTKIKDVATEILVCLQACQARREERRLEDVVERAQRERERLRQLAVDAEAKRLNNLEALAESGATYKNILELVAKVNERAAQYDFSEDQLGRIADWCIWAINHANRLDPVQSILQELNLTDCQMKGEEHLEA